MSLQFSTKAGTLSNLLGKLKSANIAPIYSFSVKQWMSFRQECLSQIILHLGSGPWIVRSSCNLEDGLSASNAGAFLSVPNVTVGNLTDSIEKVIHSYGRLDSSDEVLIQPMLTGVIRSGVAFTHDPNTCAPYRTVNWFEGSDTTIVTSGSGGRVWQQAALNPIPHESPFASIVTLLEELLFLFGDIPIDCEFAITNETGNDELWLLQARPLILSAPPEADLVQKTRLSIIEQKIARGINPHPFLMGQRTVYGVMPDWNPAEIVGIRPKPLALSLYRELVTDAIWAYQRHNYGYRNLRSFPLMPHFFGLPYIDVRLSFNSFIPADLNEKLAGKLVDHYIDRLLAEPTLHDKIEFEIVYSCYTLDLPQRLQLLSDSFSQQERKAISDSLRKLTNRIVHPKVGLWRDDAAKIDTLNIRREELLTSNSDSVERIYWLLEDAKRYGTLPFAGLARAGFVAVQMLKSLVNVGVLSQDDYDAFISSVSTVSSQLSVDRETIGKDAFLKRYGHLRPGTYDILSSRYDEDPDLYFDWNKQSANFEPSKPFTLTLPQMREIIKLLNIHGLQPDPVGLFDFIQAGIELRESAKFNFTRNLSDALVLIGDIGEQFGFCREDLAYCDIAAIKELHFAAADPKDILLRSIEQGKARYAETLKISLPPLIVKPDDVWAFEWPETAPNFITQKQITAPVAVYSVKDTNRAILAGAIVCIPNADPGFDWLFAYPIAGLITAWGGANSHMAIRAGELGLPAVIGAGEILYRRWSSSSRIHIDCSGKRVEVLG